MINFMSNHICIVGPGIAEVEWPSADRFASQHLCDNRFESAFDFMES